MAAMEAMATMARGLLTLSPKLRLTPTTMVALEAMATGILLMATAMPESKVRIQIQMLIKL